MKILIITTSLQGKKKKNPRAKQSRNLSLIMQDSKKAWKNPVISEKQGRKELSVDLTAAKSETSVEHKTQDQKPVCHLCLTRLRDAVINYLLPVTELPPVINYPLPVTQ